MIVVFFYFDVICSIGDFSWKDDFVFVGALTCDVIRVRFKFVYIVFTGGQGDGVIDGRYVVIYII